MINILLLLLLSVSGLYAMENTQDGVLITLGAKSDLSVKNAAAYERTEPLLKKKKCGNCVKKNQCNSGKVRRTLAAVAFGGAMLAMPLWVPLIDPQPQRNSDPCVTLDHPLHDAWWQIRINKCGACNSLQQSEVGCSTDKTAGDVYKQIYARTRILCPKEQVCIATLSSVPYCFDDAPALVEKYNKQLDDLCANHDQNSTNSDFTNNSAN